MIKRIDLIIPEVDAENAPHAGEPVRPLLLEPEGATPGRETPGFFVLKINGQWVRSATTSDPPLPRQFLSLDAVHAYLLERYGKAPPLRVAKYLMIESNGLNDFPAVWAGTRKSDKMRVPVRVQYIGSFRYWDGRRVDPYKVGTSQEFN